MELFRLHVFPEGSLSESVITTVWVGIWVVAFFNLRLGWTFSGLVVPGYMIPLFIARPWSAWSIIVEGIVTYCLVWFLSEKLSGWTLFGWRVWSSVFGRDRYFALLLMSLGVRTVFDGWLLPWAGAFVNDRLHLQFDYQNNLYSFGLIIIPLVANQFWKPGLAGGLWPMAVILSISYVLIRYVLMTFTNFNVGNLAYMYEAIASDLSSSPKAYVISITAAYLASRMNLLYSWEYHGIHIPALLALQWFDPVKILSTVVEAGVIFFLAGLVLKAPWFRKRSFEGAEKMLLFFTVAFIYKIALGYVLLWYFPGLKATDCFGVGYMVSTLMAIKSHEKAIGLRLLRCTLQVSVTGVLVGTLIGFALLFVPKGWYGATAPATADETPAPEGRLMEVVRRERLGFYQGRLPGRPAPAADEAEFFASGLRDLLAYALDRDAGRLQHARECLRRLDYRVDPVQAHYLCLHEAGPPRGRGVYVLDLEHPQGLAVEVPAALDEWAVAEAGTLLFEQLGGRALAVAGTGTPSGGAAPASLAARQRGLFDTFHRVVGRRNVLQVRGDTAARRRALAAAEGAPGSSLWVKAALPPGLNLAALRDLAGGYHINWGPAPLPNPQRDESGSEFAELFLTRADRRAVLGRAVAGAGQAAPEAQLLRAEGSLRQALLGRKYAVAAAGTDLYRPAGEDALLFFDGEVLTPLLETLARHVESGRVTPAGVEELRAVAASAGLFGYQLTLYHDRPTGADYLVLAEDSAARRRCWGTYVFRVGAARPFAVQVPRPLFEMNSFEYGVALSERLQASALLIAGTDTKTNRDGSADLLDPVNKVSLFNLAAQVLLREAGDRPLLLLQARAFGVSPDGPSPNADILLSFSSGSTTPASLTPLGRELLAGLERDRLRVKFVDGSPEVAGYDGGGLTQAFYLDQTANKEFGVVWISFLARPSFRQQADNHVQEAQFRGLGIPTVEADLYEHLAAAVGRVSDPSGKKDGSETRPSTEVPAGLRQLVERYVLTQDVIALHSVLRHGGACRFERVVDADSQQAFLVIRGPGDLPLLVANLVPVGAEAAAVVRAEALTRERVREFIDTRATWLEVGGSP
jgi:hypothetical protein